MKVRLVNHFRGQIRRGGTAERTYKFGRFMAQRSVGCTSQARDIGFGPERCGFVRKSRYYYLPTGSRSPTRSVDTFSRLSWEAIKIATLRGLPSVLPLRCKTLSYMVKGKETRGCPVLLIDDCSLDEMEQRRAGSMTKVLATNLPLVLERLPTNPVARDSLPQGESA